MSALELGRLFDVKGTGLIKLEMLTDCPYLPYMQSDIRPYTSGVQFYSFLFLFFSFSFTGPVLTHLQLILRTFDRKDGFYLLFPIGNQFPHPFRESLVGQFK
jgi:hypothetical protein